MSRLDLRGGVAVVTGAASGIGRATALAFAARGCAVALVDRDAAGLAEAAAEVERSAPGVAASRHVVDVADADAVAALPDAVSAEHGRVTVLVNAAGVAFNGSFAETSLDEFRWVMEINVFGLVGVTKAFLPTLQRQPAAQIANVSSLFGIVAPAGQTAYSASKFAVRGFSEALRHELDGSSVGVTVVHPGGVATALARNTRLAAGADAAALTAQNEGFERTFMTTPPEAVGRAIVRAVERRRPRLLVATSGRSGALLQRLMPVRYWRVMRAFVERAR